MKTKAIRKGIHLGAIFAVLALVFVFSAQIDNSIVPVTMKERQWASVPLGEGTPPAGESGVLSIMVFPHSADPGTDYSSNVSEVSAYAQYDTLNHTLDGDVPYDTAFDIVVKVRWNATHAYNGDNTTWVMAWVRANATCDDLSFATANLSMGEEYITNTATYMWVNYFLQDNNGGEGSGFTISRGESVNVTYFKIEAYF